MKKFTTPVSALVTLRRAGRLKPQKKGRILVVDDERTNVEVLSRFLAKEL